MLEEFIPVMYNFLHPTWFCYIDYLLNWIFSSISLVIAMYLFCDVRPQPSGRFTWDSLVPRIRALRASKRPHLETSTEPGVTHKIKKSWNWWNLTQEINIRLCKVINLLCLFALTLSPVLLACHARYFLRNREDCVTSKKLSSTYWWYVFLCVVLTEFRPKALYIFSSI